MYFRLKNAERQSVLDRITEGEFGHRLNDAVSEALKDREGPVDELLADRQFTIECGPRGENQLGTWTTYQFTVFGNELESFGEYCPDVFNLWPGVTPPADLPMRIEFRSTDRRIGHAIQRACWIWRKNRWEWADLDRINRIVNLSDKTDIRFRPWIH